MMQEDWDAIRAQKFSSEATPSNWPTGVKSISFKGLRLVGVHPGNNELYWDGQEIVTRKRLAAYERFLASVAAFSTFVLALLEVLKAFRFVAS